MRWQLLDGFLADSQGQLVEEGQTIEFKESLSSGCQREGIRSLVAFANSAGGTVLFGVRKDGFVKGVQSGQDTLERLGGKVTQNTYPSLPPSIDRLEIDGKAVVVAEIPGDTPPVIGVYLLSEKSIAPDKPVEAATLEAFRRVGRADQREDFMRLRQPQPSDPKLRVRAATSRGRYYANDSSIASLSCPVWAEDGSPTGHGIRVYLDPGTFVSAGMVEDLPYPGTQGFNGVQRVDFESIPVGELLQVTEISAIYLDDWGIRWRVSRGIRIAAAEDQGERWLDVEDRGFFTRRIIEFPPKAAVPEPDHDHPRSD